MDETVLNLLRLMYMTLVVCLGSIRIAVFGTYWQIALMNILTGLTIRVLVHVHAISVHLKKPTSQNARTWRHSLMYPAAESHALYLIMNSPSRRRSSRRRRRSTWAASRTSRGSRAAAPRTLRAAASSSSRRARGSTSRWAASGQARSPPPRRTSPAPSLSCPPGLLWLSTKNKQRHSSMLVHWIHPLELFASRCITL